MPENKSSLRLAAGILLMISALLTVASIFVTLVNPAQWRSLGEFFAIYWQSLLSFLLLLLVSVFVLARQFTGAGIAECALALLSVLNLIGSFLNLRAFSQYYSSAYIILNIVGVFLALGMNCLVLLGFFLHSKRSRPLFFCAAGVGLLNSVLGFIRNYVIMLGENMPVWSLLATLLGVLIGAAIPFLAWLFLGIYFGAQEERSFRPGYPPVPPRYPPQGGYPNYQYQGYPPQPGGYPSFQPQGYAPQQNAYPNYQNQGYPPQQGGYPSYQNQAYAPQPQNPPPGDTSNQN